MSINNAPVSVPPTLAPDDGQILDDFECAWQNSRGFGGRRPTLAKYVPRSSGTGRGQLVVELVHIDLVYRLKVGDEAPLVEDYFTLYGHSFADRALRLDLIRAEFEHRWRRESISRSEYLARFPEFRDDLEVSLKARWICPECRRQTDVTEESAQEVTCSNPDCGKTLPVRPTPDAAGTAHGQIAPGYEILEEIARGGMGIVYKARQTRLNRFVALKVIRDPAIAGPEEHRRFHQEAQAVAKLQHPSIVQIYEVAEQAGTTFLALEFLEGGTLAQKLAENILSPRDAASTVHRLAEAIQCAHECGIVHRDLKPANVLLKRDGTPKVADFGLAKRLDPELSGHTQTGAIMGTPSYMAPEQAAGDTQAIGPAVDIYALGAILYELLTGRPPFRGATHLETMAMVQTQDPVRPRRLVPNIPRDLERICLKCLEKDARHRYATAKDFAADLNNFLDGEPVSARPLGWLFRLARILGQSHLGSEFHHWDKVFFALAAAIGLSHIAVFFVQMLDGPDWLSWLVHSLGIAVLALMLLPRLVETRTRPEKQLILIMVGNFLFCGAFNWLVVGSPFHLHDVRMYPYWAIVNAACFYFIGATHLWFFYLLSLLYTLLGIAMAYFLVLAPAIYGAFWGLTLAGFGFYFRRLRPTALMTTVS